MIETQQQLLPCADRLLDVLTVRPDQPGRHPVAVLVAGSRSGADVWKLWGKRLAERGIAVVGVAQPGFGCSTGPWDFAGPATLAALDVLLVWTRRLPWVKPLQVSFAGYSSGATCACLLATRHHCRGLVGAAGVYDLEDWWAHATERSSWSINQIDPSVTPAELVARSPLLLAKKIHCPVRLIHGTDDDVVPARQAITMGKALEVAGTPVEVVLEAGRGHSSLQSGPFVDGLVAQLMG